MINVKDFDSKLLKINKNLYKNIDIYYIQYITMSDLDYVNIRSVNPLCFIIDETDGYIEKSNGNKYLTLVSNDKNKNILKSMQNYGVKLKVNN